MARDRLAARKTAGAGGGGGGYQEPGLNAPSIPAQSEYQQQAAPSQNQYSQQSYTPVPGMGPGGATGGQQSAYSQPQQPVQQSYAQQPVQQSYAQQGYEQQAAPHQYGQQDRYDAGGVAGANGNGVAAGGDFWTELANLVQSLNEMQDSISQVRQAHIASLSRLDTTPNSAASRETDELIASTRALTASNKNAIQKLNKLAKDKAQKQQVQAAKSRFMSLLQEYQTVEKEFRKKVKERGERQYKIVKPDATPEEVKQVLESENPQIFSQALLSSNRYGDARGALREIQERNQDIKKIEKTLTELAQMFNEMSMLVEQQDETIATIETQAGQVNNDMEQGLKYTEQAVVKARKARRKKWICFWLTIAIIIIAAAIVVGIICGQGKCK
ncbi:hypothetical protein QFC24_003912 [Naganishia onofrii]|uniref:Uncharacterized protein n=1 Tax=Naganishia onofrii TaxID=1851511 RepID=A0ACC2XFP8_9TREE|nr:hypothetical protein QFC24_003912 [Naganishia onofrii]